MIPPENVRISFEKYLFYFRRGNSTSETPQYDHYQGSTKLFSQALLIQDELKTIE